MRSTVWLICLLIAVVTVHSVPSTACADDDVRWFPHLTGDGVVRPVTTGAIEGEPFVVRDPSLNDTFILYFFSTYPSLGTYMTQAPSIDGPWSAVQTPSSLEGCIKFVLLVDVDGNPCYTVSHMSEEASYHGYCVASVTTRVGDTDEYFQARRIRHFTSPNLTGPWQFESEVLSQGGDGSADSLGTDAPYALQETCGVGEIYLFYMAMPRLLGDSATGHGYNSVARYATATAASGPFVKSNTSLVPWTGYDDGAWDGGWFGGVQVRRSPYDDSLMMIYNASPTTSTTSGDEPAPSMIGVAFAENVTGPWVPYQYNPVLNHQQSIESSSFVNFWRGHLVQATPTRQVLLFNAGGILTPKGGEGLFMAEHDTWSFTYPPSSNDVAYAVWLYNSAPHTMEPTSTRISFPGLYGVTFSLALEVSRVDSSYWSTRCVSVLLMLEGQSAPLAQTSVCIPIGARNTVQNVQLVSSVSLTYDAPKQVYLSVMVSNAPAFTTTSIIVPSFTFALSVL